MIAAKDAVLESLKNLPDDATFEDIIEYVSLMAVLEQDSSPAPWDVRPEIAERLKLSVVQAQQGQTLEKAWIQANDKQMLKRVNMLIRDTLRTPFEGLGKPEPLKNEFAGKWSRRITEEHRLVYEVRTEEIVILLCLGHYER
jgi:toxin YoeB